MGRGGVDHRGAIPGLDAQVVQVGVVVDEDGGDGLGLGLACLDIGGEDLVAGLELALIGTATPEASRTFVSAVRDSPPQAAAASARSMPSSAAKHAYYQGTVSFGSLPSQRALIASTPESARINSRSSIAR